VKGEKSFLLGKHL